MIRFPYLFIISAPFYLVSFFSTICGISRYGRNMVSDNAGVIHCLTASTQRERENYSLAPNLENFMNIDRSGFDSLLNWAFGPLFPGSSAWLAGFPLGGGGGGDRGTL